MDRRKGRQEGKMGGRNQERKKEILANLGNIRGGRMQRERQSRSPCGRWRSGLSPAGSNAWGPPVGSWSQSVAGSPFPQHLGFFPPDNFLQIPHKSVLGVWREPSLSLKTSSAGRAGNITMQCHTARPAYSEGEPLTPVCHQDNRGKA